jgi:NAD+ synthase
MDLLWYAKKHDVPIPSAAEVMGFFVDQVQQVFKDFARKERTTKYLRLAPITL